MSQPPLLPSWWIDPLYVLEAIDGGYYRDMMRVIWQKAGMPERWITDAEIARVRAEGVRRIDAGGSMDIGEGLRRVLAVGDQGPGIPPDPEGQAEVPIREERT